MDPTDESEDLIDCRNAIENIGLVDDRGCALVKCKPMTNKIETNDSVVQNGDHLVDSTKEVVHQNCITNGTAYESDEKMVDPLDDCSHNGVVDINDKISDSSVNNIESATVVVSEEIGLIEVISEEQVICGNSDEETDSHVIKNDLSVEQYHRTDEKVFNPMNTNKSDITTNSEDIENVCNRYESSVDFEAENSSLSENSSQHSQQSSASQQMPVVSSSESAINASSAANAMSSQTNGIVNSQSNEGTNVSSVSGLTKKKFGKFRILDETHNMLTEDMNDSVINPSEDQCFDSKFDDKSVDSGSGLQDSHDNSEQSDSTNPNSTPVKSNKQNKRRGRPAGSTKKDRNCVQLTAQPSFEDEDMSRRRSSRLKTLEARKEQEKAVIVKNKDIDETSDDSNVVHTSDANDSQNSVNESSVKLKQKKKKSKKDKNKSKDKNRDKDNDSKKRKRKKVKNDENNCFNEQKSEKCKTSDFHKNEYFAAPLPPTHYSTIKSNSSNPTSHKCTVDSDETSPKPEKVKSRWRRNSELESGHGFSVDKQSAQMAPIIIPKETEPPPPFDAIEDNIYLFERRKSKSKKETRRMVCDCILTKEERTRGLIGCGEDCLNRMLMIECGSRCSLGDHCANKRFQKKHCARVEPFRTAKKGWGLRTLETLQPNTFIMEYIGEVIDPLDFHNRTQKYSKEKIEHHYFMALKSDEIIDATVKGNITRFVNHSCDPNSETQKWTVNGELRIGFFTQRLVQAGEEITFDYQFQRYGKEAQKCLCESPNCRGYIGATESADILTDGSKITATNKLEDDEKDEEEILEDLALEEEIAKLSESGGLRNRQQVLMLARLMVRAEDTASRIKLIDIIKGTIEMAYLRLLLDYHGLQLIWSWMVEVDDSQLKAQILELLEILPIPNKTMLTDSKVFSVVERWSQQTDEEVIKIDSTDKTPQSSDIIVSNTTSEVKQNEEIVSESSQSSNEIPVDIKPIEPNVEIKMESSEDQPEVCSTTQPDEPIKMEESVEIKELNDNIENEPEDNLKEETKESVETSTKSSPRISIVIKPRSLPNCAKTEVPPTPPPIKSKPSIASLAQKLLLNWKELKEVFRIPRLERQKRHEDEKEADRKTREVEERRARGLPIAFDKRGIDDRDYTIAGILGIKRKGVKRNDSKDTPIKKSSNSSQQILFSNWNKVSKEEHRKMFEMEVAQKDYHEALKRYHQELAYYNAVYGHQIQAQQQQQQQQQLYSQESVVRDTTHYDYSSYNQYYQNSNYSQSSANYAVLHNEGVDYTSTEAQYEDYIEDMSVDDDIIFRTETTPALIPLANVDCDTTTKDESSLAIDSIPNDRVAYSDSVPSEILDETSIFDAIYPPPGVFYVTPDPNQYFTPLPIDSKQRAVNIVFNDRVIVPFESNWTKSMTSTKLPLNWKYSYDKNGNIYYYNKIKRKSQWMPPEEEKEVIQTEIEVTPVDFAVDSNDGPKLSDNEDSTSVPDVIPESTSPKLIDEPMNDDLMDSCIDSIAPDSITTESDDPINSTNSPSNLLQSILALEADPRKRRQLLNSVMPSTTTAAADTSSSSNRRKFTSTRQIQEQFRNKMSEYVVHCLNPYRKPECKKGRILNNNDFKFLARKITHTIMGKEIKQCKSLETLSCNDAVKHKTKDYVKRYMGRFGPFYKPDHIDRMVSPKDIAANDSND